MHFPIKRDAAALTGEKKRVWSDNFVISNKKLTSKILKKGQF